FQNFTRLRKAQRKNSTTTLPGSKRLLKQPASALERRRISGEPKHVPGERMVARGHRLSELRLDLLDDARHAQARARDEDAVASLRGAKPDDGVGDRLGRDARHHIVVVLVEGPHDRDLHAARAKSG